jgi:hypothetical protein
MTVKVAVVSVETHTGGFVTVRKISPVTEKIPCAVIDVWISIGTSSIVTTAAQLAPST